MEITEKQRGLIRHAIGLDGHSKVTNRNHFCSGGPGCTGYEDWEELVAGGLARRGSHTNENTFWATKEAAELVCDQGEKVSEDFR